MKIRNYRSKDCAEIASLFYNTVHTINAKDYTSSQLDVWATGDIDIADWDKSFLENNTIIVELNNTIVGFGDVRDNEYLERLFVHKDYQGKGIASIIVSALENQVVLEGGSFVTTHASITAKRFFEKKGYHVVSENTVIRNGVELANLTMKKQLV